MRSHLRIMLITSFCMFAPTVLQASSCTGIIQKIDADLTKYTTTFKDHKLVWANLSWLKQKLGQPKKTNLPDNLTQYEWRCAEDTDTFVAVQAGKDGNIINVNGQYNSEKGSNLFSNAAAAPEAPSAPSAPQTTAGGFNKSSYFVQQENEGMLITDHAMSATCSKITNEIRENCEEFPGENTPPFQWESIDWLKSNLGNVDEEKQYYMWRCNDKVRLAAASKGDTRLIAVSCESGYCSYDIVERKNGKLNTIGFKMKANK